MEYVQETAAAGDELEDCFEPFRRNIVGYDQTFASPYGSRRIVYADWTASGRLYAPIEDRLAHTFGPFVGNTHSESSETGTAMTQAYHEARRIVRRHVNAGPGDVVVIAGFGMTAVICKLQRLLGLRVPEHFLPRLHLAEHERPVVFVTHMEHHSNHTSWLETVADVEVIPPTPDGLVDVEGLQALLERYRHRPLKIGSFTACSNVTGIRTPYHTMARLMHEHGGYCFVDFAASAPYVDIDMHPADPLEKLDAVFFSPHKFLGGPGGPGIVVFDGALYHNRVPDQPGGGTVSWTNPWGQHHFVEDIEAREDGGTPGFLQTIRAALAIRLKEQMRPDRMLAREEAMLETAFAAMRRVDGLRLLAGHVEDRLAILSFYVEGVHYNLMVKLLNDRFGVQVRGGCSCAGTYGHYLLHVDRAQSKYITDHIDSGDLSVKPGWVRLSLHPTTTDAELDYLLGAVEETVRHARTWEADYAYDAHTNEYVHLRAVDPSARVRQWFDLVEATPSPVPAG